MANAKLLIYLQPFTIQIHGVLKTQYRIVEITMEIIQKINNKLF